ncbi:Crp/Fnr family transcriptional regulator [Sphingosinicella terrae]|uniref:Crp/Fnr family transcriptional regulator n=1 Tax=Sphingosinicella terrae TaxID=2172047 RepID=UPI000E0D8FAE|nr:Crp/Fnr family transcriptional regulator [Sphingosinicella terrae]
MRNPLRLKLEQYAGFEEREGRRLDELVAQRTQVFAPKQDILTEGEKVKEIHIVLSGLAARYKLLDEGERQIMAFLIPGDICDLEVFVLEEMDHGISAMTETVCAVVPAETIKGLLTEMSCLTQALWWSTMTDSAVLRERIIDHGRRDARERIAHLFYELLVRYRIIDEAKDNSIPFPLTQEELADSTGLTPVHVNRTLKQLREDRLIELKGRVLKVLDPQGLRRAARFNPNYLHLRKAEEGLRGEADRVKDLV